MKNSNLFLKSYKNLKVLVTGSTGFKGAWLSFWLNYLGSKVIGIGLKPERDSVIFQSLNLNKKIKQYYVNINNFKKLNSIIKKEKPDLIFHLAAQSIVSLSYDEPIKTFETNILGSLNVLEAVRKNKISSLVYITSDKCYLNIGKKNSFKESDILGGLDNYSSSKASAEIIFNSYFKSYHMKNYLTSVTTRAGNVIGGGDFKKDRIVPDVIKALKSNRKIFIRNPNATRPWQHVLEPLSGYLILGHKLMKKELSSKIKPNWNFGPLRKNCKKVIQIVKLLNINWSNKPNKIIIKRSDKFYESQLLSLNINKAKKELSWQPRLSLNETIKLTTNWYKAYFKKKDMSKVSIDQINFFIKK